MPTTTTSHSHSHRDREPSQHTHSHRHRSRSRSRTRHSDRDRPRHRPDTKDDLSRPHHKHTRSRSRSRDRKRARHSRSASPRKKDKEPKIAERLPFDAKPISKYDFEAYKYLFASFLSVQKEIDFEEIDERERKGRFKQFVKRWNAGELSRGWYDPERRKRAEELREEVLNEDTGGSRGRHAAPKTKAKQKESDESDDDTYGPAIPGQTKLKAKVTLPTSDDLALQKELEDEARLDARADLAFARKLDRKSQKEALDELVPRAEAGTRERQLERKREVNDKMKSLREKSPGAELEVDEGTLMGGSEGFKEKKAQLERKKNERELRKEALLRQRQQERDERLAEAKAKEEKTMALLFAMRDTMLAKNRGQLDGPH